MQLNADEREVLEIVEQDARLSAEDIAKMAGLEVEEVKKIIKKLEDEKIIVHYSTLVDWSKIDDYQGVTAMIDVKVTPKRGVGFGEIAERIYRFKEVSSVYLMSGAYD
ncbi:MAG TPA: Lrp/AsnC family transcriptional regulator, partial [Chondromyces sp.]|nr:Lrp/AsnC family transcriptional regulator [Chondromyces sp.]